jgi:sugar/nucleoside kinase (ribokinase family)
MNSRNGILAGGNFIIDHVKLIDAWPAQDMLATIMHETSSNGGGPYNVLKDLAAMQAPFPLSAVGLVGQDANGTWIIDDCQKAGIDTAQLHRTDEAPTSYTDAMTVVSTGRRTFFHQRGANALLGQPHFDFAQTQARVFHLGYLMLLDEMDRELPDGSTVAAHVLAAAQHCGLITTADIVSTENPRFRLIAEAALPHIDHLVINEIEAGKVVGTDLRSGSNVRLRACIDAAQRLIQKGVRQQVVIHFAEGAVAADAHGQVTLQGSLQLPPGFIVGATGAGDAFAAGYLWGVHEAWSTERSLELAVCAAAACLTDATPSRGLRPMDQCLLLAEEFQARSLV